MSNYPTFSTYNGGTVMVTIPPGWFTYVTGLARNSFNQMIRLRVTNHIGTNTEHLFHSPKKPMETNEMMKLRRTHQDSYSICATTEAQQLELTCYYSTDPNIKGHLLEKNNAVVSSVAVLQTETPKHLLDRYPDYVTYLVFVQASPDQEETEYTPLYNDAVCTINLIQGTGLDHDGFPMDYEGSGGNETTDKVASNGSTAGSATSHGTNSGATTDGGSTGGRLSNTPLDVMLVQQCTSNQQPYIEALTDNIIDINTQITSGANLAPDALRLGLIGFGGAASEYIKKSFPFTTDASVMRSNLSTTVATSSSNGPEAVAEALNEALLSEWRIDATKMAILITDPPLHGISESTGSSIGDSSAGEELLKIVRRMAELGITLHLIPCEPSLNISHSSTYDFYKAMMKITGGLVLPLASANALADCIIGSSLERVELGALIAKDGKMIARRVLFKNENPEALTEEYHARYTAADVTITTLEIKPVHAEQIEEVRYGEVDDMPAGVVTALPFLDAFAHLLIMLTDLVRMNVFGARLLPETASKPGPPSSVVLSQRPISKEQTGRIIALAITENAEVLAPGKFIARPTIEDPVKNSCRINVPTGWYGFVSGLSRIKYNQAIKLCYSANNHTNIEFLTSERGQTDNIMRLKRTRQGFFIFAASEESNIVLDTSFFWSRDNVKGSALGKPQYCSEKLKVIRTQTPMHSRAFFPDYITYLIMAEDQPDADQVPGVPEFNDCVCVVNLIKKTPMVDNDDV